MCVRQLFVKSLSPNAPKVAFVPCGRCEECRDSNKYQWQFRLRCELDFCRKQHWNIGFFTLTYSDEHLPIMPDWAFKGDVPEKPIQCFNRVHLRNFIDNIRKRLHELYRVKSLRYMICSEFVNIHNVATITVLFVFRLSAIPRRSLNWFTLNGSTAMYFLDILKAAMIRTAISISLS